MKLIEHIAANSRLVSVEILSTHTYTNTRLHFRNIRTDVGKYHCYTYMKVALFFTSYASAIDKISEVGVSDKLKRAHNLEFIIYRQQAHYYVYSLARERVSEERKDTHISRSVCPPALGRIYLQTQTDRRHL
jgi:hypothetical protein